MKHSATYTRYIAAAAACALIAHFAYDLRREYAAQIETTSAKTHNLARVLEEHARQSLRRVELSLVQGAEEVSEAGGPRRADRGALSKRLRAILPTDGLISLFLVLDRDGAVVASTLGEAPGTQPAVADRDYFLLHRERAGRAIAVSAPGRGPAAGSWTLPVSVRLEAPGGAFRGVLVAFVDPARLQEFYDSIDTGANGFVTLFQREGWIVVRSPFDEQISTRNWAGSPMFREHLPAAPANTVRQVVAADGVERIYSYRALADYPVVVSLGSSLTDSLAPWRARAWRDGALLVLALGALAAATWALARQLERREAAEAVARENAARLALATQAGNVGLWDWDLRTNRVFFSREWKSQLGYAEHEITQDFQEWQQRLHPDDLEPSLRTVRAYIARPWPGYELECRLRHKDGSHRWILARGSLEHDEHGKPVRMLGSHVDITERKQAHEALRESEQRLRAIIEAEPECVKTVSPEGRLLEMNPAGLAMLEAASLADVQSRPLLEFLLPEHRADFAELHGRVMRGESGRLEFDVAGLKGGRRRLETHAVPLADAAGRPAALLGITRDITERRGAEQALRATSERLRMLVESSPLAIYTRDRDGLVTSWNPAAESMFGWSAAEVLGRPLPSVPDLLAGESLKHETLRRRRDGSPVHADAFVGPLRDGTGAIEGIVAIVADVTERRLAEQALRESEERYRDLVESVGDLICTHDLEGKILFVNRASAELLGYPAGEMVGMNLAEILDPQVRAQLGEYLAALARDGAASGLMRVRTRAGEVRVWEYRNMLRVRGGASLVHGVARDVTERRRAEEERNALSRRLITAQEEERRRIALELHDDIGQALTAVKLNLQVIRRARGVEARGRALEDGLAVADEAAERVRSMAFELRPQVLDDLGLGPALDSYCARQSRRSSLRIETDIEPAAGAAKGPAALACYRIAQEALTNALRHAGARELRVTLVRRTGRLLLGIADDGAGFDPRRVRGREAIGLLGMRERARDAGGTLSIESRPGDGTRVLARFPLKGA